MTLIATAFPVRLSTLGYKYYVSNGATIGSVEYEEVNNAIRFVNSPKASPA